MTKEKFTELKKAIESQYAELKQQEKDLKQAYIEANVKFHVGQKVSMTEERNGKIHYGFVRSIRVGYWNEIEYKYVKMKKDGTPSSVALSGYGMTNIKAVEE